MFIYAVYYFFVKTKMYGFFQTTFYFGYMTMFCLTLAVMCGNRPMFLRTRTAPTPPNSRTQTPTGSNRRPIAVRGGAGRGGATATMRCPSGGIGYGGSHLFVHRIYRNIKSD